MACKNRTVSDTWRWGLYLVIGVLFMAGVVFLSSWQALHATEARFCQILDFVKSQSTSFEKHNDTVVAKALRRTAVSVHQLAQDPALDLSDPQCLNRQAEKLWLTGISVLSPDGTLLCESTTNGIGYAAAELAAYLGRISGAQFMVASKPVPGYRTLLVGAPYKASRQEELSVRVVNENERGSSRATARAARSTPSTSSSSIWASSSRPTTTSTSRRSAPSRCRATTPGSMPPL